MSLLSSDQWAYGDIKLQDTKIKFQNYEFATLGVPVVPLV